MNDDGSALDLSRLMQGMASAERANAQEWEHTAFVRAIYDDVIEIIDSVEELEAHCRSLVQRFQTEEFPNEPCRASITLPGAGLRCIARACPGDEEGFRTSASLH